MNSIEKLNKKRELFLVFGAVLAILLIVLIFDSLILNNKIFKLTGWHSFQDNGNVNLNIYDDTDSDGNYRYAYGNYPGKIASDWNVNFYADFKKSDSSKIGLDGSCSIRFKLNGNYGAPEQMTWNSELNLWTYTRYFASKGEYYFKISCTSSYGDAETDDNFTITNTPPYRTTGLQTEVGQINCNEDDTCNYNLSSVIKDDDSGDSLTYVKDEQNTTLKESELQGSSIIINVKLDANTGNNKKFYFDAEDTSNAKVSGYLAANINAVNDFPSLALIGNKTAGIGKAFSLQVSSSDTNLAGNPDTPSYKIESADAKPLLFLINPVTGLIKNSTELTKSDVGIYLVNVSVEDTEGKEDYEIFSIIVYDSPWFNAYAREFSAVEGELINISILANHTIGNNLNYSLFIGNETSSRISEIGAGDGKENYTFKFIPDYTDESSCERDKNITIRVKNPEFSNYSNYSITIAHKNAPVILRNGIQGQSASGNINLKIIGNEANTKFYDADYSDRCYNQSIIFSFKRFNSSLSNNELESGNISVVFNQLNGEVNFSSIKDASEWFEITLNDSEYAATSNRFLVNLTTPPAIIIPVNVPVPSAGGGGGSSEKPVLLKLIMPGPVSLFKLDRIELPIMLENQGTRTLNNIFISSNAIRNGQRRNDIKTELSLINLDKLEPGKSRNLTLTIISKANETGNFEILINATVKEPNYYDWGKIYVNVQEINSTSTEKLILFTEELIVGNPECLELRENIKEAENMAIKGNNQEAFRIANSIIDACKSAIASSRSKEAPKNYNGYVYYAIIAGISLMVLIIIVYYLYRKIKFKNKSFVS